MPQISEAESVVLEALWRRSPRCAEEVVEEVAPTRDWTAATVKTLLNRLLKKGAIVADKDGRRYLYSPLLSRDDYLRHESKTMVDRLFGGKLAPLVSHFSEQQDLDKEDIDALRALLKDIEDGQ